MTNTQIKPNKSDLLRKVAYFFSNRHVLRHVRRAGHLPLDVYVPNHADHRQLIRRIVERIRECDGERA